MNRALRYDGLLAAAVGDTPTGPPGVTPGTIRAMKAYVEENQPRDESFDIVWEGETPGDNPERAAQVVRPFVEAGITWWMEPRGPLPTSRRSCLPAYGRDRLAPN